MEGRGFRPSARRRAGVILLAWALVLSLLAAASAVPSPPDAALFVDDATPFVNEPVAFDASASRGHDEGRGRIVAYRFDFGDGTGTAWQASPFAEHTYTTAGRRTATVTARDARDLEGRASVDIDVRAIPPPTDQAPDLSPIAASVEPPKPEVDDVVHLAVTILNRGGAAASSAAINIQDLRPSGAEVLIDTMSLPGALGPAETVVLISKAFLAVESGDHLLRVVVRDVEPTETKLEDNVLELPMRVTEPPADGGPSGDSGLVIDPVVAGLALVVIAALVATALVLRRPKEPWPPYPPPATPPDERPPPAWPP